ncbi:CLN3 protein [Necator americanus]|uniref:Battenin n=1 Tax=Necator americanus TaxID=51031 RepID=W2SYG7_NECAM|nr:CLN3 protein [Necator americanus]ETN74588.1 CLN3 protein [Necator americanus]
MLSAAQDILNKHKGEDPIEDNVTDASCVSLRENALSFCNASNTVLVGESVDVFVSTELNGFFFRVRHTVVCVAQASSLLITAFADSVPVALGGVCLASFSSGLGETTYLGLAGHYSKHTIATWSSGTGMAGVVGAFSYAGLTDRQLLALSPTEAMLVMLVVPALFMFTFYILLEHTETMKRITFSKPKKMSELENPATENSKKTQSVASLSSMDSVEKEKTLAQRLTVVKSLLRYMIPLFLTYFAEYLINQGLLELTVFDCSHGFGTSPASQYRWYQVLYQVGVFISRSSINIVQLNMLFIALMPVFQLLNTIFFLFNAIYAFLPNFGIVCAIVLYEGLIGGSSYVNTFHHIHKKVDPSVREFALSTVSLADSVGIIIQSINLKIYVKAKIAGITSITSIAPVEVRARSRASVMPAYENAPIKPAIPVPDDHVAILIQGMYFHPILQQATQRILLEVRPERILQMRSSATKSLEAYR